MKKSVSLVLLGSLLFLLGHSVVQAATLDEWKAVGTSTTWATAGNWVGGTPTNDLTTNTAYFNSTSYSFQPNAGTTSIAGIQVGDGTVSTGALTITTAALSIGSSGILVNANAGTVSIGAVKIGVNQNWTNNSSSLLTLSSTVTNVGNVTPFTVTINGSGTGGATITGIVSNGGTTGTTGITVNTTNGITSLNGANTFTGGLNIQQGTVKLGNATGAGAGLVTIGNTGTNGILDLNGASRTIISLATAGTAANQTITNSAATAATLNYTGATTSTFGGVIENGSGGSTTAVTVNNASANLTLSGANTYTGLTTVTNGTLVLGGSNTGGGGTTLTAGTLQLNSATNGGLATGGTLTLTGGTLQAINVDRAFSNAVTLQAVTVSGSQNLNIGGKLTGLTGGARTLTNNITSGKALTLADVDINTETANVRTLTIAGSGDTTINGTIANGNGTTANGLTISNTGTTTLNGVNTYTGLTTVSAGTVKIGANNAINSGNALTTSGTGIFDLNGFDQTIGTLVNGGNITNSSVTTKTLTFGSGTAASGAGSFTGAMNVIYNPTSNVSTLSGSWSNTGNITVNVGGVNTITLSGTSINNTGTITNSGAGTGALTISGNIGSNVGLITQNSATSAMNLSGTNTNVNGVTSSAGAINITAGSLTGSNLWTSGTGIITQTGGVIAGTGTTFTQGSSGSSTLSGANTYTGVTTIDAGILTVGTLADVNLASSIGTGSAGGSAADLVFGGGTLRHSAANVVSTNRLFTIGNANGLTATLDSSAALSANTMSFTGAGALGLGGSGARTLTLTGSQTGTNTLASIIGDGSGGVTSLVKSGAGQWVLSGANTYTGTTSISAGTLSLTGSLAGSNVSTSGTGILSQSAAGVISGSGTTFTQGSSGTSVLAGANTYTGATTVNAGTLSLTGSLTGSNVSTSGTGIVTQSAAGVIAGSGTTFTQGSTGVSTLGGTNTYTGPTTISDGTLSVGVTANLGGAASNLVFDGGTLRITGTALTSVSGIGHTVITNAGKTVGLDINTSGNTFTFDQVLNQTTGGLTKLGAGTLVLNQANTYSGMTNINAGTVSVDTVGNTGSNSNLGTNGTINIGDTTTSATLVYTGTGETSNKVINLAGTTGGATLNQSGASGNLLLTGGVTATGLGNKTLTLAGAATSTGEISGAIVDSTGFATAVTKNGSATWTLSGANTYSGLTNLSSGSGSLIMSGSNSSAGATTVQTGTLVLNSVSNGGLASGLLTLGSGGSIQVLTAATLSNAVTLAQGSGGFSVSGSQNITFNGDVNFIGNSGKGFVNNLTGSAILTLNGAFLNLNNSGVANVYATNSGSGGGGPTVINSVIQTGVNATVAGSVVHNNTGILTLAGANTYAGGTTLSSGTLRINNGGSSSSNSAIGTGLLTITAGTIDNTSAGAITLATNNAQTWNGNFIFTGSNDLNLGTGAVSLGTTAGTTRTVTTTAGNLTVGGAISNGTTAFGLIKAGAGQLTLAGSNTYTGTTSVQNGTLSVATLNSVVGGSAGSSLGAPVNATDGTIALGNSTTTGSLKVVGSGETTDRVINLAGTTGGGTLDQSGTGLLKFTSNFTATGGGSKTLTLQGSTAGTGEIAGAIVNNSGTNKTSVAKSGTGIWTLSGANTYTGSTTVSAGTLMVSGTLNSGSAVAVNGGTFNYSNNGTALTNAVTVAGGNFKYNSTQAYSGSLTFTSGTVSGTGNLSGTAFNIGTGQVMAPGNSTGAQAVGATSWDNGGTFQFELNDATGIAGSITAGWDLLNPTTLTLTAGAGQFTLQIISLDSLQAAGLAQNFNSANNYSWMFVDAGATITGFNANQFAFNTAGFQNGFSGSFSVSQGSGVNDDKLFLNYTAVPEPSTYAMLAMGLGSLWLLRRKRKV